MAGERATARLAGLDELIIERERALPQPGGRPAAPGELVVVQAFLNTHFDLVGDWGADILATSRGLVGWFAARGLLGRRAPVGEEGVRHARALRDGLRTLVGAGMNDADLDAAVPVRVLNDAAAGLPLQVSFRAGRARLDPAASSDLEGALSVLLAIAVGAMIDGTWVRLKVCPGEHCGWVFYDSSRNNAGRWCSMAVCGGRAKARSHYRRRRGIGP